MGQSQIIKAQTCKQELGSSLVEVVMYVRVHTVPGAKKERVRKEKEHVYTISVREPAERNMANRRIREILAEQYETPLNSVKLLTGHRSTTKMFSIDN